MRKRAMIVFSVLVVLLLVAAPVAAAPAPPPGRPWQPVGGPPPGKAGQPVGGPWQACARYHVVRFGETLYSIGRMYGVSPWSIASANRLPNMNRIYAGQCLCIPPRPPCQTWWCGGGPKGRGW